MRFLETEVSPIRTRELAKTGATRMPLAFLSSALSNLVKSHLHKKLIHRSATRSESLKEPVDLLVFFHFYCPIQKPLHILNEKRKMKKINGGQQREIVVVFLAG